VVCRFTFVSIDAGAAITGETVGTGARKSLVKVGAGGVLMAVVGAGGAFVDGDGVVVVAIVNRFFVLVAAAAACSKQ